MLIKLPGILISRKKSRHQQSLRDIQDKQVVTNRLIQVVLGAQQYKQTRKQKQIYTNFYWADTDRERQESKQLYVNDFNSNTETKKQLHKGSKGEDRQTQTNADRQEGKQGYMDDSSTKIYQLQQTNIQTQTIISKE